MSRKYHRDDFNQLLETLSSDGVVLLPDVAGWYIGALATSNKGVAQLFSLLPSDEEANLELLIDNSFKLSFYLEEVPEVAYDLMELSAQPLTLFLSGVRRLADELVAKGEMGFRVAEEPLMLHLCTRLRQPMLVALVTSKRGGGMADFYALDEELIDCVDYVAEFGRDEQLEQVEPSAIRLSVSGEVKILKQ